jgi:hypothetical protein
MGDCIVRGKVTVVGTVKASPGADKGAVVEGVSVLNGVLRP